MAKVYLSPRMKEMVGNLQAGLPFTLQRDGKGHIYSRRTSPYCGGFDDSHWEFLKSLADMCLNGLYIVQIDVSVDEIAEALSEKLDCKILPLQVLKWTGKKMLTAQEFLDLASWLAERNIGA